VRLYLIENKRNVRLPVVRPFSFSSIYNRQVQEPPLQDGYLIERNQRPGAKASQGQGSTPRSMAKAAIHPVLLCIAVYYPGQYTTAILHGCTATHLFVIAMIHLQYFPTVLLVFL
jgi:hypothetical protein